MTKFAGVLGLFLFAVGCGKNSSQKLTDLSAEFVYRSLAFSPSAATQSGLHEYQGKKLDELLDDFSPENLARQASFYGKFQARLADLKPAELTPEDRADLAILQDQLGLNLMDLNEIHSALYTPQMYVETLGNALFAPHVLEYAPKPDRLQHIIARLKQVPLYLDQASTNLTASPLIWTQVAIEENQGNINLVDKEIRSGVPPELAETYARAARPALEAMTRFDSFLKGSLTNRPNYDWRMGGTLYPRKFRYTLHNGVEPDDILQQAERAMVSVRARMLDLALPLHREMFPAHKDHGDLEAGERANAIIGEVLGRIADRHSTVESYMDDARKDLEEARAFVQEKHILTLPPRANLTVIPTPEFMRGIYSVGGFNAAPALQPQLGAFYWITPIPTSWSKERKESKLREYNFYKLKLLTIHEAMPGHYVQMERANEVNPQPRRLLRSVYGNGPYVEGWGQYATQVMLDEGLLNHSPELALTFAKEELRVLVNTILDVRLHMLNMTDEEAMDWLIKQAFQEKEEAVGKLQRAKLSSAQLPMYFVGWRAWIKLRDEYKQSKGAAFNLAEFHDRALKEGAVPLPILGTLIK
jgi:uncharacterized protein (DUF885 family)